VPLIVGACLASLGLSLHYDMPNPDESTMLQRSEMPFSVSQRMLEIRGLAEPLLKSTGERADAALRQVTQATAARTKHVDPGVASAADVMVKGFLARAPGMLADLPEHLNAAALPAIPPESLLQTVMRLGVILSDDPDLARGAKNIASSTKHCKDEPRCLTPALAREIPDLAVAAKSTLYRHMGGRGVELHTAVSSRQQSQRTAEEASARARAVMCPKKDLMVGNISLKIVSDFVCDTGGFGLDFSFFRKGDRGIFFAPIWAESSRVSWGLTVALPSAHGKRLYVTLGTPYTSLLGGPLFLWTSFTLSWGSVVWQDPGPDDIYPHGIGITFRSMYYFSDMCDAPCVSADVSPFCMSWDVKRYKYWKRYKSEARIVKKLVSPLLREGGGVSKFKFTIPYLDWGARRWPWANETAPASFWGKQVAFSLSSRWPSIWNSSVMEGEPVHDIEGDVSIDAGP